MDLALEAEISPRHMSFLETGRSRPSREMVLRLAERLELPPRETNHLLTAAGFAAVFPQRSLDDPGLAAARRAVDLILAGHEPHPAPPSAVGRAHGADYGGVAIPLRLASDHGPLSFLSTTTLFGTAVDVTLSELILETFFAADEHTAKVMGELAAARAARANAA